MTGRSTTRSNTILRRTPDRLPRRNRHHRQAVKTKKPLTISRRYAVGMSVQMTVRVDDDLAAFIDEVAKAGRRSRVDVINRAIQREVRRRAAVQDAHISASSADPDPGSHVYAQWAAHNARQVSSEPDRCTRSGWLDSIRRARSWCSRAKNRGLGVTLSQLHQSPARCGAYAARAREISRAAWVTSSRGRGR